jgi:hypothetical protein
MTFPGTNEAFLDQEAPQPQDDLPEKSYGSAEAILKVLGQIGTVFSALISSTGADPGKTRDTARRLDLSINLVWPVSRIINADDILTASSEVIDRIKLEKVCDACEAKGATADVVGQARQCIEDFEELISTCTGDRQSFSLLLKGLSHSDVTSHQESTRKTAFLSNSSLWGVQCRLSFKTVIFTPNTETPDQVDAIRIFGMVDFRRLRPVPWPLCWMFGYLDDGTLDPGASVPIEPPLPGLGAIPLLKDFCSHPLPALRSVKRDYGIRFDLDEGPIGNAGLLTCVVADRLVKWQSIYKTPQKNENLGSIFDLVTPQEHMVFDIFLHQDLPPAGPPQCTLFDRLTAPRGFDPEMDTDRQLPFSNPIQDLKPGLADSAILQYPRYPQMLEHVFHQSGLDVTEFKGYRLSIRYPQIPTAADLQWELPKKP